MSKQQRHLRVVKPQVEEPPELTPEDEAILDRIAAEMPEDVLEASIKWLDEIAAEKGEQKGK